MTRQQQRNPEQTTRQVISNLPEYRFLVMERYVKFKLPNSSFAPRTVGELLERLAGDWVDHQSWSIRNVYAGDTSGTSEVLPTSKIEPSQESTFIVIMDFWGAQAGRMPRGFYRGLEKLQGISRLQKSVYEVTSVTSMKRLVDLGRGCGFQVQAFQVSHRCDAGNEVLTWLHAEKVKTRES